jgi:hypothetical protein
MTPAPSASATADDFTTSALAEARPRTRVILIVEDSDIQIITAATGEILRQLAPDPSKVYQPTRALQGPTRQTPRT